MKYITRLHNKKSIGIFFLLISLNIVGHAQDKLFFFGGSKAFKPDSIGTKFNFSFNRTESVDPDSGPILKAWRKGSNGLYIRPSASIDIGSLSGTAEDNVLANISLVYTRAYHQGFIFITEFSPTYTADKNFQTGLVFVELTPTLAYHKLNKAEHLIVCKISFDYGDRVMLHKYPDNFARLVPDISYKIAFAPKFKTDSSKIPLPQYFKFTCNLQGKAFIVNGDKTIIKNGAYGYFSGSFDYRINKKIALTLKYTDGYVQPTFKQVNAISFGLSIYP